MAPGTRVACSLAYGPDGSRASSFVLAPFTALSSFAGYHPPLAKPLDLLTPLLSRQPPLSLTLPNASRGTLSLPLSLPPFHPSSYPISSLSIHQPVRSSFSRALFDYVSFSFGRSRVVALSLRLFSPIPSATRFYFFLMALSSIFDRSTRA